MIKREPKLRPSMSWGEMSLAIKAIDAYVTNAVQATKVTRQVMEMAKVKEYLETFKPVETSALSEQETLAKLMAKYGVVATPVTTISEQVWNKPIESEQADEPERELTDDERYDMLKLTGEANYSDEDKLFMLNKGTMIMMQRAGMKKVTTGDL